MESVILTEILLINVSKVWLNVISNKSNKYTGILMTVLWIVILIFSIVTLNIKDSICKLYNY